MLDFDVFARDCPSREAFDAIFSRWGFLLLARLDRQPVRFGVLRRSIGGISEKMLAETLRVLEAEGLVVRHEWDEKPPRVEYALTPAGTRLAGRVRGVIETLYETLEERKDQNAPVC